MTACSIVRRFHLPIITIALLAAIPAAAQTTTHEPIGIQGFHFQTEVPFAPKDTATIFQQIVPCRLVDTRIEQVSTLRTDRPASSPASRASIRSPDLCRGWPTRRTEMESKRLTGNGARASRPVFV
jgi:hypothetical protein